jgi:hypothetical protein
VVDAGHQGEAEPGQAEHPVGQHLVVVDQVEVAGAGAQRTQGPEAERERLGERAGLHHAELQDVDPVPVLRQFRGAERVVVGVQIQAGHLAEHRARFQLRVGLAGEHLDVVPERGQFTGQVTQVDALAAAVRLAAVGQQRDAQRPARAAPGAHHAGTHLSLAADCPVCAAVAGLRGSARCPPGLARVAC